MKCTGVAVRACPDGQVSRRNPVISVVMFLRQNMRVTSVLFFLCAAFVGCQTDFLGHPASTSTTTPTPAEIQRCRDVMYINPAVKIEPLGFFLQPGMDDIIRFKFVAQTNDPALVFDSAHVDAKKFGPDVRLSALEPGAAEKWWDVSKQTLTGGNFSVPPPKSSGTRGLNIGYTKNADGTLTVYVLWHET